MNLSELIETHKGRRSYPELARECGGVPSSKRLQQLVREPIKNFPDPPTVAALARGLRVPQREVILSAAESLGLEVHDTAPRLMQLMPVGAQDLSEEQAAAIAHLVDVIVGDPRRTPAPGPDEDKDGETAPREPTVLGVRRAQRAHLDKEAARDVGRRGSKGIARDQQDRAGEPAADDPDDMEPR